MDLKTRGKEGTNAKGQKKDNAKLEKVNKKPVNDGKSPGKEKKDDADDVSNNFPNFSVLNQEERLAFFEALSAARKNIEKRGLPTRERFGTVHDEYLQYFSRDDKGETVQKKPESAPSASRSPVPTRKSPKESKHTAPDSPKQRAPRTPEPVSPPKRTPKPPPKNPRPESEPNDFCEAVIKRDTDQMIQMYLDKKKRVEEQWKKDAQATKSPPPVARPRNREATRPPSGRPASRKEDTKPKTPSKPVASSNNPQFNPNDRKEFFKLLKEDNTNVLFKNPQQKDDMLTPDEVLKPYKGAGKATTACPATQVLLSGKQQQQHHHHQQQQQQHHQQQQQQKNLRVKVTLTSGDNKRLCRTKSQVLNDSTKEGSGGKSKSLESVVYTDMPRDGKQSKIPILRKAPQERSDCSDVKTETQPVKKTACEDSVATRATEEKKPEAKKSAATEATKPAATVATKPAATVATKTEAAETKKTEAPIKEKALTIKDEPEVREDIHITANQKKKSRERDRRVEEMCEECEEDTGDAACNLAETKAELKKVRKEKEKTLKEKETAVKEKEKAMAEAAKKEKELLRKKKKQEWKKRHQKKEPSKKGASAEEDCKELKVVGVRLRPEQFLEEEKKQHPEKKKTPCEKEELATKKTSQEKGDERECKDQELPKMQTSEDKGDERECKHQELPKMQTSQEKGDECECKHQELPKMQTSEEKGDERECKDQELPKMQTSQEKGDECECKHQELPKMQTSQEKGDERECKHQELFRMQASKEKGDECESKEQELTKMQASKEKGDECECKHQELSRMQTSKEKGDECEEKMPAKEGHQKEDSVQKEQEEEEDEEEDMEEESEESSPSEKDRPRQQSAKGQAVAETCQQQSAGDFSGAGTRKEASGLEHHRVFSSLACSEHIVKAATHSRKSLAGMSLLEKRPEETWQAQEMVPTYATGKVVVVDDNVIKRIKDLIQYLDKKANSKDNLQSEYVRLVLSYTEYLTKVTESLILAKNSKKGQQVHSTYAAPEVHLKFEDGDAAPKVDQKKTRFPHSISETEFEMPQGPSGIEKKDDTRRKQSRNDFDLLSDSGSSTNSEDENRTLSPSVFKKTGIPMTKIRLLQDLLNGRAKFEEGSIDDFKIVHMPEGEYVPPEKPPREETKEIIEADVDQGQKAMGMKFLRNLVKLCNCGKKQVEEDAILENLKGEAVRVDTAEPHKNPASATINDSTMEVLKAAERKRIIEKYLKKEQS